MATGSGAICAYAGCRDNAGQNCTMVPPLCKNHCDCEGHDRRRARPGASKRGRRNPAPAALRGNVQEHYRTLSEIIEWLEESDAAEMHAAGLLTHSAARKALAGEAVQIATQGWATDPNDASPWAVFLEAIPTNMTSRLYQEVKQSLRRRGLPVYEFLSARPDPAQGGHGTSLSSSRLFSRSPPPQPASTSSSSSQMHVTAAPPHLPPSAPLERQRTPADASGGITRPSTRALLLADVSEELRMEDMTRSVVEACWESLRNISIRPPPPAESSAPAALQFSPGGSWPWNDVKNHVTSHIGRVGAFDRTIHLQRGKPSSLAAAAVANLCLGRRSMPTASDEILVLQQWIDSRPGLRERIAGISVAERPPYIINGIWLQVDLVHSARSQDDTSNMRVGWHGTAMASLYRCIVRGPEAGWAGKLHGGEPRLGIYMHCDPRADLTSSYMLHSPLRRSGWLWSPLLELHWPCPDPSGRAHVGRGSKDTSQYITYPDVVTMPRVFFHLSHASMWSAGDRSQWISVEPRFPTECEVDPTLDVQQLFRRSERSFRRTVATDAAAAAAD